MNKYENEIKYYEGKEIFSKSENDYILIVDNCFKEFDDNNDLSCTRKFIKINDQIFFDFTYYGLTDSASLSIALSDKKYSSSFLTHLLEFLTSSSPKLQKYINNVLVSDYRTKLHEVKNIKLYDAIVTEETLKIIKKMFPNLEILHFINCKIEKDCSFNVLNSRIIFDTCEIENTNSFNSFTQPLNFHNCKINDIKHSIICSKTLTIDNTNDAMLEKLFLSCHFPELQELTIGNFSSYDIDNTSYKNSLLFLPKACPNLLRLKISGNVYSFNFLSMFNKLGECEIRSNNDSVFIYELYTPYIENEEERNFIIAHSKNEIKNEMDEHFALLQKLNETVKALNKLGMSKEEKDLYLNRKMPRFLLNPMDRTSLKEAKQYYLYDSCNNSLSLISSDIDHDENNCYEYTYKTFNNVLYRTSDEKKLGYLRISKKIDLAEQFIYNPVGMPIVFRKSSSNAYKTFETANKTLNEEWYKSIEFDESYYSEFSNDEENEQIGEPKSLKPSHK